MSKKGQLVVPSGIRNALDLNPEDTFVAYGTGNYVVFKKVDIEELRKEFRDLVELTSKIARERGITDEVVIDEIAEYRKEKRRKDEDSS